MMKRKRWSSLGVLLALPLVLFFMAHRVASWRPQTLAIFSGRVQQVKFSPDGKTLVVVSQENPAPYDGALEITFWDAQRRTLLHRIAPCVPWVAGVVFSPDSHVVLVGSEEPFADMFNIDSRHNMRLVNTQTMQVLALLPADDRDFMCFWHSNAILTAVGMPEQGKASLTNERVGPFTRRKRVTEFGTGELEFSPDADTLASVMQQPAPGCTNCYDQSAYNGIQMWSFKTGKIRAVIDNVDENAAIRFSPDGKMVADDHFEGVSMPNTVCLWNVQTGKLQRTLTLPSGRAYTSALAFSPEGKLLAGANQNSDSPIALWDVQTGQLARTLVTPNNGIESLDFSPDGGWLASANSNHTVTLWRIK